MEIPMCSICKELEVNCVYASCSHAKTCDRCALQFGAGYKPNQTEPDLFVEKGPNADAAKVAAEKEKSAAGAAAEKKEQEAERLKKLAEEEMAQKEKEKAAAEKEAARKAVEDATYEGAYNTAAKTNMDEEAAGQLWCAPQKVAAAAAAATARHFRGEVRLRCAHVLISIFYGMQMVVIIFGGVVTMH
jgi:hypothetical protein